MDVAEKYVRLCGEVSQFTKEKTGVSFVDAYFGPENLNPELQKRDSNPEELLQTASSLIDQIHDEVESKLRAEYLIGDCRSIAVVVEWLNGKRMPYADLVRGIFHIPMREFPQSTIDEKIAFLDDSLHDYPGTDLRDKVTRFNEQGEITGLELKNLIENDLQAKAVRVGEEFREKIYSLIGASVTDNGVEYQTVREAPWSGYNWYQPGYKSINQFNLDMTFNKDSLLGVLYHEYEHHVSNLWREKHYNESGNLELAVVPLHTGRCVISEGTADTAKEFLHVVDDDSHSAIVDALNILRRMTSINAAIMLNDRGRNVDEVVEYMIECGFRSTKSARSSIGFISPTTPDGRLNFWAPYVFTYFFGKTDFVLPMYNRAVENEQVTRFYQTLYLNTYSGSSVTWKQAFDWLR
jgi:hypothetical protein